MSDAVTAPDSGDEPVVSHGWAEEVRASFRLAWPLIVAQVAQNLLFTTDVVLLGWLGPKYLAAGTLANAFLMPCLLTGISIVGAVAPLVAQARGGRRIKDVRRVVRQGLWVAILLATVLQPVVLNVGILYDLHGAGPRSCGPCDQLHPLRIVDALPGARIDGRPLDAGCLR
jgi:MATE family multidrug resistance protein